ncbi:ethyl tert-butyl ether degradation EthD [Cupriavidus basilensis OR16]|uniref:Ethyl tert-butyl ether degradation EthD n=1 Tax=Cupriavidus basilensis OR16 TaxID=1127483 RepID=H1S1J5_9BURK|nr:EthD family reductase [Cupriavidus basilensis]EHP43570.1 ethyl tert-butyl ether degradation EthD [Cupriavidus basilensis OR16]
MIKVSFLYPHSKGGKFDMDYYLQRHVPRAVELFGVQPGFRGVAVERGLGGGAPGSDPAYTVMFHFLFESVPDFVAAAKAAGNELQLDIPNYTDAVPVVQISEVLKIG